MFDFFVSDWMCNCRSRCGMPSGIHQHGEGVLSSNYEDSVTFAGRSVRRWRWCYLRLGKGEMVTPQGG